MRDTLPACTCSAPHSNAAIARAVIAGGRGYRRATSSPYLFCRQLDGAFDAGYRAAQKGAPA